MVTAHCNSDRFNKVIIRPQKEQIQTNSKRSERHRERIHLEACIQATAATSAGWRMLAPTL